MTSLDTETNRLDADGEEDLSVLPGDDCKANLQIKPDICEGVGPTYTPIGLALKGIPLKELDEMISPKKLGKDILKASPKDNMLRDTRIFIY